MLEVFVQAAVALGVKVVLKNAEPSGALLKFHAQ